MSKTDYIEQEFDLGLEPAPDPREENRLLVVARGGAALSPAQAEFNKLMKRLENARAKHLREEERLDALVVTCTREVMPLIARINRVNHQMVRLGVKALGTVKLTPRRQKWLGDLLAEKAGELLNDSWGLSEEEQEEMRTVVKDLGIPEEEGLSPKEEEAEAFDFLRGMMEKAARQAGVDLDLSDLDVHGDPDEFERKLKERLDSVFAAEEGRSPSSRGARVRKPGKAQLEREKKQREAEEAKRRDLKSLYKQLAKVLHPDLERDPARRAQKEEWMKRLTTAHAAGDLRELLCIEMEWLGVEASNLESASDEKLGVYCAVLKEQIAEVKMQTSSLMEQPRYAALACLYSRHAGCFPVPSYVKVNLEDQIARHEGMLKVLRGGGAGCRKMLNKWADEHARIKESGCPF